MSLHTPERTKQSLRFDLNKSTTLLQSLQNPPAIKIGTLHKVNPALRLMKLEEINEENPSAYRNALANVYAALDSEVGIQLVYLLDCGQDGVSLYFGISQTNPNGDAYEAQKNLLGSLEGQLPGIHFGGNDCSEDVLAHLKQSVYRGLMFGTPTAQADDNQDAQEEDFQGIERLVRTLASSSNAKTQNTSRWQMIVVAQPLSRADARAQLDSAYDLASELSNLVRTSVQAGSNNSRQIGASHSSGQTTGKNTGKSDTKGKSDGASETKQNGKSSSSSGNNSSTSTGKNWGNNTSVTSTTGSSVTDSSNDTYSLNNTTGNNLGITKELTDKRSQHLLDQLEKVLIPRLQKGVTKGLFATAVYLCAETASTYRRLKNTICATYQGSETTFTPLEVYDLPKKTSVDQLLQLPRLDQPIDAQSALFHSLSDGEAAAFASLIVSEELALIAGLPRHELPGLRRRKTVDFIVDLPKLNNKNTLHLGCAVDHGRRQSNNSISLNKADFNKHIFVTGVTGAGKTTTCLNLLLESDLPFLVIEPAKTEYRALHQSLPNQIEYYRPNGDPYRSFRINPFALIHPKQKIKSHASFLRNVLTAVFPMEASMPYLVEQAILRAYEDKGWDLTDDSYLGDGDPFSPNSQAWPTMNSMIAQLDPLIKEQGMGKEFEEKYRGSLVSRLTSLTLGALGDILDVRQSMDFCGLVERKAVIELEELRDSEGKALIMALLLGAIGEAIRYKHGQDNSFRHLTLVEEAHRLLAKPEMGDKATALAVESFADMLAEVRKYGEGLIIADQIPAKLIPDVIKNTHTKIVHRVFAEDDRRAMGESMMMTEQQRDFLPNLATGEAIVFCGGWHGPAHAAIRSDLAQTDGKALEDTDLDSLAIEQLWQERTRYYPMLNAGGLFSDQEKAYFASYVQSTRLALNSLLFVISDKQQTNAHGQNMRNRHFNRLKQWLLDWQDYFQASDNNARFIDALYAFLVDANPRPHPSVKEPIPWDIQADESLWKKALQDLTRLLMQSNSLEGWENAIKTDFAASVLCRHVFNHLRNYKNL